jgi:TetR/AcrR family transcriptional regulator, transcriptional repressor for nem operon
MGRTSDARARLITAAMELMYARGYTAVGVQELCAHAGVHKGSFYHFFPSKQALALAVIETHAQHLQRLWHEALLATCSPLERLQRAFEATHEAHCHLVNRRGEMRGCPLGNFAIELSSQDDVIRQKLAETFNGWTAVIERMLREAVTQGDLPALDVDTTAQTLIAYFEGVLLLAKMHNDPGVVKKLAQGAVHLVEAAARACLYESG